MIYLILNKFCFAKETVGRSIDAVRDLEEPEFSARNRNTQVKKVFNLLKKNNIIFAI